MAVSSEEPVWLFALREAVSVKFVDFFLFLLTWLIVWRLDIGRF